jgi:FkbM family methyltransferase
MNLLKHFVKINSHNILVKPFAGLGRSVNRFYENRNHNAETNGELRILQKISKLNPQTIFDVGANVGDYAALSRRICPDTRIYSFEPVKSTFQILEKNLLNKNIGNVIAINKGLFKEDKKIEINIYPGHEHASLHDLKGVSYSVVRQDTIEVVNGDRLFKELRLNSIDLLKLDIEGAEMDALLGFGDALKARKIRAVQFEYGYINITSKILLCDYYDFFRSYGYIVGKIYPKSVEFREYSFKHEDFIGPNFIAIHQSDHELKMLFN